MKTLLGNLMENLRTSFWFLPSLFTAGAVVLSLASIRLDRASDGGNWLGSLGWTFSRGPEGSRAVLAAIAGSMMTITSVAFSITVLVLQQASSQFGPRLLRNFMKDRGNQLALAVFVGTFTYCLLILRTVNGTEADRFVPHFSVSVGLLLATVSIGFLIYFIHHTAESIQADHVISSVAEDLRRTILRLFPAREDPTPPPTALPDGFEDDAAPVRSKHGGYVRAIDVGRLVDEATRRDVVIRLELSPGAFTMQGGELARVWPGERLDGRLEKAVRDAVLLGKQRSLTQDVEFAIEQLVEVAVRALSPGVNDPFTAMTCVDRLGEAMLLLAARGVPTTSHSGPDGALRVAIPLGSKENALDTAFHQIRQYSRGHAAVTIRLLETLTTLAERVEDPEMLRGIQGHASLVEQGAAALPDGRDRYDVEIRYRRVQAALKERAAAA